MSHPVIWPVAKSLSSSKASLAENPGSGFKGRQEQVSPCSLSRFHPLTAVTGGPTQHLPRYERPIARKLMD